MNKMCPLSLSGCRGKQCGWFCEEEGRCAIAVLPSTLDWLTRFAVARPYEREEVEMDERRAARRADGYPE